MINNYFRILIDSISFNDQAKTVYVNLYENNQVNDCVFGQALQFYTRRLKNGAKKLK